MVLCTEYECGKSTGVVRLENGQLQTFVSDLCTPTRVNRVKDLIDIIFTILLQNNLIYWESVALILSQGSSN